MEAYNSVVATAALLLAVASLGWQAYSFKASGHRVQVRMHSGVGMFDFTDTEPRSVYIVEAANVGRAPVQVVSWSLQLEGQDAGLFVTAPVPGSSPLPCVLEPGHRAQWFADDQSVRSSVRSRSATRVVPQVTLGTGEVVRGEAQGVL